jgi:predicted metal-dependent HD superfamily phosphohydrolase
MKFQRNYRFEFAAVREQPLIQAAAAADFEVNFVESMPMLLPEKARDLAVNLYEQMNKPRLFYHIPVHVLAGFQFYYENIQGVKGMPQLSQDAITAYWYHDAVYYASNSGGTFNEDQSIEFMRREAKPHGVRTKEAEKYILATAHHLSPESFNPEISLLLDIDISNFAYEPEAFRLCQEMVAKEFEGIYSAQQYEEGRKQFLRSLMARGFIFRTPQIAEKYKKQAEENIESALK